MCKVKYADNVNTIMPEYACECCKAFALYHNKFLTLGYKNVDKWRIVDIIVFTDTAKNFLRDSDVEIILLRPQGQSAGRAGYSQPPSGRRQGFPVSGKRIFRSTGSLAGQVRDAASASNRGLAGHFCRPGLRLFTCYLLPDSKEVRRGRAWRTFPQAARTEICPQTLRGANCLCRISFSRRSDASTSCPSRVHQSSFRYLCPPAQHRASPGATTKKTPKFEIAWKNYRTAVERYEQLRSQALDRLATGPGLGLFVQQGMSAWIRAWGGYEPAVEVPAGGNTRQYRSSLAPDVVMILAGMALSCVKEGGKC